MKKTALHITNPSADLVKLVAKLASQKEEKKTRIIAEAKTTFSNKDS